MADVLIFDDDPSVGDLMGELLRGRGLTVSHFLSGAGVVQLVQENKPKLVILDIMMPGMDGLTACKTLKSNPATRGAKIAILTAKNYEEDQATAMRYGADLFLHKPFDPGAFAGSIGRVLGLPDLPAPAAPPAPPVVVTILPGAVVAETAGMMIVFDAGKGLKGLLERQTSSAPLAWFLISRYRPENSSEISAGALLLKKGARVNVAGPDESESKLQQLAPAMCATLPNGARATPLLYPQREGEFALAPGIRAVSRLTQHAGTCLAYRVELQGRAIVYCPAHEIHPDLARLNKHEHAKFRDFFKGADLLLHGYRRSLVDESPKDGIGSGAWEPVVDLAAAAGVKRIALMPLAPDTATDGLQFRIEERLLAQNSELCFGVTRFNERVIL
ncbi:MAG: response regulator [Elusimicrobia bacterium]|nr:response regulator [Elusimicrobiota bacterium]